MPRPGPVARPTRRRLHRFNIYFSEAELDRLELELGIPHLAATVRSKGHGLRRGQKAASTRMRQLVLNIGGKPVPVANREAFLNLGRLGANLQDIAKQVLIEEPERELINAILAELAEFREALMSVKIKAPPSEVDVDVDRSPGEFEFLGDLMDRRLA